MPSFLAWLAHSETERERVREAIALLGETETRDELGIGTIRDALADLLLPGVTVLQRRARYFFFVPWMYLEFERRRVPAAEVASRARRFEIALIDLLDAGGDRDGIIGIEARQTLKRLPSNIYWRGLGVWGIRRFTGNQDEYHRSLDRFYLACERSRRDDDGDPVEGVPRNWDPGLPGPPSGFGKSPLDFRLTRDEAAYLRERLRGLGGDSLLSCLVEADGLWEEVPFAWQHPDLGRLPAGLRATIEHARNFSDSIHGAALLYNLLLAEARPDAGLAATFRDELAAWARQMSERATAHARWERSEFWSIVARGGSIPPGTRQFVDRWLDLALPVREAARVADLGSARELLAERERRLKGGQARLANRRALERWNGRSGTQRLDFRWHRGQRLLFDILEPLSAG